MTIRAVVYDFHRTLALPPGGTHLAARAARRRSASLRRERRRGRARARAQRGLPVGDARASGASTARPRSRARSSCACSPTPPSPAALRRRARARGGCRRLRDDHPARQPRAVSRDARGAGRGRCARRPPARALESRLGAARDLPRARAPATAHGGPHLRAARRREAASGEPTRPRSRPPAARPSEILFVGDTYEADVAGPERAGMQALLMRRPASRRRVATPTI